MRIKILSLIRKQEPRLGELEAEYLRRIRRRIPCEMVEIKRKTIGSADRERILREETERVEKHLRDGERLILLSEKGRELNSRELACLLDEQIRRGNQDLVFLIGGPLGLSEVWKRRASDQLSLSRLTFPHRLARLILLEAIYRSFEILGGGPYPK